MIKIKSNIKASDRALLQPEAQHVRSIFVNGRAYNAAQKREQAARLRKKFLVKGRFTGGRRVWDVYQLEGDKQPVVVGAGFGFQEEAISFARDRTLGREAVSFGGGLRGVFSKGRGGLLVNDRSIEKPGEAVVPIKASANGVVVG